MLSKSCFSVLGILTLNDFKEAMNHESFYVIDVRGNREFENQGRLEQSVNIPWSSRGCLRSCLYDLQRAFQLNATEFRTTYGRNKPAKNDQIVISGFKFKSLTRNAAKYLRKIGYFGIRIFYGEHEDLQNAGLTVIYPYATWINNVRIENGKFLGKYIYIYSK